MIESGFVAAKMPSGSAIATDTISPSSVSSAEAGRRLRISASTPRSPRSFLHQRPIIEPAVEPILISADVLLHRDVDVGLEQRNARHVCVCQIDEALHVLLVRILVPLGCRRYGAID